MKSPQKQKTGMMIYPVLILSLICFPFPGLAQNNSDSKESAVYGLLKKSSHKAFSKRAAKEKRQAAGKEKSKDKDQIENPADSKVEERTSDAPSNFIIPAAPVEKKENPVTIQPVLPVEEKDNNASVPVAEEAPAEKPSGQPSGNPFSDPFSNHESSAVEPTGDIPQKEIPNSDIPASDEKGGNTSSGGAVGVGEGPSNPPAKEENPTPPGNEGSQGGGGGDKGSGTPGAPGRMEEGREYLIGLYGAEGEPVTNSEYFKGIQKVVNTMMAGYLPYIIHTADEQEYRAGVDTYIGKFLDYRRLGFKRLMLMTDNLFRFVEGITRLLQVSWGPAAVSYAFGPALERLLGDGIEKIYVYKLDEPSGVYPGNPRDNPTLAAAGIRPDFFLWMDQDIFSPLATVNSGKVDLGYNESVDRRWSLLPGVKFNVVSYDYPDAQRQDNRVYYNTMKTQIQGFADAAFTGDLFAVGACTGEYFEAWSGGRRVIQPGDNPATIPAQIFSVAALRPNHGENLRYIGSLLYHADTRSWQAAREKAVPAGIYASNDQGLRRTRLDGSWERVDSFPIRNVTAIVPYHGGSSLIVAGEDSAGRPGVFQVSGADLNQVVSLGFQEGRAIRLGFIATAQAVLAATENNEVFSYRLDHPERGWRRVNGVSAPIKNFLNQSNLHRPEIYAAAADGVYAVGEDAAQRVYAGAVNAVTPYQDKLFLGTNNGVEIFDPSATDIVSIRHYLDGDEVNDVLVPGDTSVTLGWPLAAKNGGVVVVNEEIGPYPVAPGLPEGARVEKLTYTAGGFGGISRLYALTDQGVIYVLDFLAASPRWVLDPQAPRNPVFGPEYVSGSGLQTGCRPGDAFFRAYEKVVPYLQKWHPLMSTQPVRQSELRSGVLSTFWRGNQSELLVVVNNNRPEEPVSFRPLDLMGNPAVTASTFCPVYRIGPDSADEIQVETLAPITQANADTTITARGLDVVIMDCPSTSTPAA